MNCYEYVKKCVNKRQEWLKSLKNNPCADCKVQYPPCVMDWHHLDPLAKSFGIGNGRFRNSREKILAEIAKCILLCANCHRLREYQISIAAENGYSSLSHKQTSEGSSPSPATNF